MTAIPGKADTCVIHIGTEKTGTSSLQHFLSKNRLAFKAEGVVYPSFTGANGGSQWGFFAALPREYWQAEFGARLGISDRGAAERYGEDLIKSIDHELASCPSPRTLVISSEHFHSRLQSSESIAALKRLVSRWSDNFRIIVYFRRQDRVALSHYSTKLKTGDRQVQIFPAAGPNDLPYYYDYARIYSNWACIFGASAMRPRLYARHELADGDLIKDFCRGAGLHHGGKLRPPRVNASLNEHGIALIHILNDLWPATPARKVQPLRHRLVSLISKHFSGQTYPVSRDEARRFYGQFRACNRQLASQAFPMRKTPLFPEDFSDYPATLADSET